jgi:hypothetical protein
VLLPAISFHLLWVVPAILLPIAWVGLAPLPWTFQTDLSINRIGSDLAPMIITLALALACGLTAYGLTRMIRRGLKDLLAVATTELFHQAASQRMREASLEAPLLYGIPYSPYLRERGFERGHDYAD